MDPLLAVIWSRAAERVLVVVAGIAAIWIGYRLFALMPTRKEGESKLELPGGISIFISRVGPGTLFALFGAGLIAYSATRPVTFERDGLGDGQTANAASRVRLQTMTDTGTAATARPALPAQSLSREAAVAMINTWLRETTAGANSRSVGQRTMAAREAKLAIMREVWDASRWGPYDSFHQWVIEKGGSGEPPPQNAGAAQFFLQEEP